jgi:hypothetical protein
MVGENLSKVWIAGKNEAAGALFAAAVAFEEIGGPDTLSHRR